MQPFHGQRVKLLLAFLFWSAERGGNQTASMTVGGKAGEQGGDPEVL